MMAMRALVIGGNGFIGSHLVEGLRADGHMTTVLDPGPARNDMDWSGVGYIQAPYTDAAALDAALDGCEIVFHLASTTVPATSNADPAFDVTSNLLGALGLIAAMRARGLRRIVFFSSGGTVYGGPDYLPIDEAHPLRPISSYGVVKVAIEQYLGMYQRLGELEPLILRPSNPYGPRQSAAGGQGFVAAALARAHAGERLQIWGDGEITRDYIYIDDLIRLVLVSAVSDACGVFNAGSGEGQTLNSICTAVEQASKRRLQKDYLPARAFDVREVVLDTAAARMRFAWVPRVSLDEGIARTWRWLDSSGHLDPIFPQTQGLPR
jgi:UDP-glucose 4-epimerase